MYFVSATRLKLSSIKFLRGFMSANNASIRQLVITSGFVMGKELMDKGFTFWTLTMWGNDTAMKSFRNSEPHRKAMQKLPEWCKEATYTHWLQEEAALPDWKNVHERILKDGIITKVRNPTEQHLTKSFHLVKWTRLERNFRPVK